MLVFVEEREKILQQQAQPTCDIRSGNWTQTKVVGCESSQHCAISAPHIMQTQVPPAPPPPSQTSIVDIFRGAPPSYTPVIIYCQFLYLSYENAKGNMVWLNSEKAKHELLSTWITFYDPVRRKKILLHTNLIEVDLRTFPFLVFSSFPI